MSANRHNTSPTGTLASPTDSTTSSRPAHPQSDGNAFSASSAHVPSRTKRFSIQFPIQLSGIQSPSLPPYSPSYEPSRTSSDVIVPSAADENESYLHNIAAQERRVLELKEELQRAEADLEKWKLELTRQEAYKTYGDAKRSMSLHLLQTDLPVPDRDDDTDGSSTWRQQDRERRKALLSTAKPTNRTVFPGQRHARTLSLLSLTRENVHDTQEKPPAPTPPPRKDSLSNSVSYRSQEEQAPQAAPKIPRSAAIPFPARYEGIPDPDGLLRAGRKAATDLKFGLWTFWEDLRQATVGEESTTVYPQHHKLATETLPVPAKQSDKSSLRDTVNTSSLLANDPTDNRRPLFASKHGPSPLPDLADPSFWSDHAIHPPQPALQAGKSKATFMKSKLDEPSKPPASSNESWENWEESPVQSRSSSSMSSETYTIPSTISDTPRTSMSPKRDVKDPAKKESGSWPAIKNSSLETLRKTANNLLTGLENSLASLPGHESDYEGNSTLSAEAAANEVVGKAKK